MNKKKALRLFFSAEIIMFSWFYFYGPHGMQAVARIRHENSSIEQQIAVANQEIKELETQVIAWQTNDFLKEKAARELLQLAREGDQIYRIDVKTSSSL